MNVSHNSTQNGRKTAHTDLPLNSFKADGEVQRVPYAMMQDLSEKKRVKVS